MGPFGLVELEGTGEGFQHLLGGAPHVSPLEAGVVLHADAGEEGDLLPP